MVERIILFQDCILKDCIVELNTAQDSKKPVISFTDGGRGCINDLEISNSTFYDLSKGGNFLSNMQIMLQDLLI